MEKIRKRFIRVIVPVELPVKLGSAMTSRLQLAKFKFEAVGWLADEAYRAYAEWAVCQLDAWRAGDSQLIRGRFDNDDSAVEVGADRLVEWFLAQKKSYLEKVV